MNWHSWFVATEFRLTGGTLAIASLLALADFGRTAYLMHNVPPPDNSPPLDIGKYGLVGLLTNGGQVAGRALHTLSFAAGRLLAVMAVVAVVLLLLGALIYFTGDGISRQRDWARVVGALLSLSVALITIRALFAVERGAFPIIAVPAVLSLYTLWALVWRYT